MPDIDPTVSRYIQVLREERGFTDQRIRAALARQLAYARDYPSYLYAPARCIKAISNALTERRNP